LTAVFNKLLFSSNRIFLKFMDELPNSIIRELKMLRAIITTSIPFILFGVFEDSIMFQVGRITKTPFWMAIIFVIIPLSIISAYVQVRFFKDKKVEQKKITK
jgi:hypothetical protein